MTAPFDCTSAKPRALAYLLYLFGADPMTEHPHDDPPRCRGCGAPAGEPCSAGCPAKRESTG